MTPSGVRSGPPVGAGRVGGMPGSILGNVVLRVEDPDLLSGRAAYVDNLQVDGVLHLAFVRSPMAHGIVRSVDVDDALGMPGVVAVFTAADLDLPPSPRSCASTSSAPGPRSPGDGALRRRSGRRRRRRVEDRRGRRGRDGRRRLRAAPAAVDPEVALAPDAPVQFEELGSNLVIGRREPGRSTRSTVPTSWCAAGSRTSAWPSSRWRATPSRSSPATTATVTSSPSTSRPRCRTACGPTSPASSGSTRTRSASSRRTSAAAFGGKAGMAAEHFVAIACALRLGRPVKWVETRSENLVSHGPRARPGAVRRDGLPPDGTIVGLRCRMIGDAGAYAGLRGACSWPDRPA